VSAVKAGRVLGIDAARGVAIALMIASHTVKALLSFEMMPDWGIVPAHLVTKFSSSLFVLVFGVSAALIFVPKAGTATWPSTRWKLWRRSLLILFWYKLLIVVQMFERYDREAIVETLLWKRFPDFVEILQFYAGFLLLMPLFLGWWRRLSLWPQLFTAYAVGLSGYLLREQFDFWGIWQLKAVLVEDSRAYCFGLLTRGSLALFGMALGGTLLGPDRDARFRRLSQALWALGTVLLVSFFIEYRVMLDGLFLAMAKNYGKHPPNLPFMMVSLGGAMVLLGTFLRARGRVAGWVLGPLAVLGRDALFCFNAHILIIFLGYRSFYGLRHQVTYEQAVALTVLNALLCGFGAWGKQQLAEVWRAHRAKKGGAQGPEADAVGSTQPVASRGVAPVRH